jgi:3-oxoadipate enol-lactonase
LHVFYFIHGAGCTAEVFEAQLRAFPGSTAITLPGHRGEAARVASIAQFADAVAEDIRRRGLRNVVLCGNSMGGAIALDLALRGDPPLRGVVLIGSGAKLRVAASLLADLTADFPAAARSLAEMFFADPIPERVRAATALMLRVGQTQTLADFRACDAFDVTGTIGELRLPLLALAGERDQLTPPKFARFFAGRVAGAEARILPAASHLAMLERPDETNAALRAFVERIGL